MLSRPQRLISTSLPIAALLVDPRAPPRQTPQPIPPWVQEAEEHYYDAECETGVERCGEGHCVFAPPGGGAAAKVRVEDEADEGPDGEIETGL